jgi:hypothetical protein
MAVFGAPIAHEDDPERAVRASLAIRDTVAEVNRARPAATLEIQLGIATGEAVVAIDATTDAGEAAITGAPIANAARLQAVTGRAIQLPCHHAKVRRDGYTGHRRGGPAQATADRRPSP